MCILYVVSVICSNLMSFTFLSQNIMKIANNFRLPVKKMLNDFNKQFTGALGRFMQ